MIRPWLTPLTPLYAAALALRNARLQKGSEPIRHLRHPVISIGNLSTGGSGKTPLTIALAQTLTRNGFQVDILSRGYGRRSKLPARVNPAGTAEEFGDEPLLIARQTGLPVYVAPQRFHAGQLAEAEIETKTMKGTGFSPYISQLKGDGALAPEGTNGQNHGQSHGLLIGESTNPDGPVPQPKLHLLDDGYQHRQLHRDIDILLLSREDLADHLLPAGNLREPLSAIRRATIIAIPAEDPTLEADLRSLGNQAPIWRLLRTMQVPPIPGPAVAFCGIARPAQFFAGLSSGGLQLAAQIPFKDHHRYTPADLARLVAAARQSAATTLITTEKDLARLGKLAATLPDNLKLETAALRTEIEDEPAALDLLLSRFKPR